MTPKKIQIIFVRRYTPAFETIMRLIEYPIHPGQIVQVDDPEFESLKNDLLVLELDEDKIEEHNANNT